MSALEYFEAICHIPHRSFHTQALGEFLCAECVRLGYIVQKDRAGNIYAYRADKRHERQDSSKDSGAKLSPLQASSKAHSPKVCLQAHYDMVGVGAAARGESLELWRDGQYLRARDSSLGADNGAAIAAILWLMEQGAGDFEVLFTNDEEVGLCGANALELPISAPFLLNLDSEFFGEIIVGCAGGFDAVCEIPAHEIAYENAPTQILPHVALARESKKSPAPIVLSVESFGFIGGHSGVDIHKDIASSIVEFFKLTSAIYENMDKKLLNTMQPKLLSLHAGEKSNSIAVGLGARIMLPALPPILLLTLSAAYATPLSRKSPALCDDVAMDSGLDFPYRVESTSVVDTDITAQHEWRIFLNENNGDESVGFIIRVESSSHSPRKSSTTKSRSTPPAPESSTMDSALSPQLQAQPKILWGWDLGRIAEFVAALGHGVHTRSSHIVQSSLNIALAHTTDSTFTPSLTQESLDSTPHLAPESHAIQSMPESTDKNPRPTLIFTLKARANTNTLMEILRTHITRTAQAYCPNPATISNSYSPWQRQLADDDPQLRAIIDGFAHRHTEVGEIHAGLECGILYGRFCSMGLAPVAMASIGPTILYPHSTKERLDLGSFEEFLQVLERIVKSL